MYVVGLPLPAVDIGRIPMQNTVKFSLGEKNNEKYGESFNENFTTS